MYNSVFYIIIVIIIIDYLLSITLKYLNSTRFTTQLPNELQNIYDENKYAKSQRYHKETTRFSLLTETFSFVLILLMLFLGGFNFVDQLARSIIDHQIFTILVFFGIIMLASDILSLPFSIYSIFVIEEKYGFNKTTIKTFIFDKIKGWLIGGLIGGLLLSVIIWFYNATQEMFWIYTWLIITGFSVFMMMFYSNLIVPLFNKQTPLPDDDLKNDILNFSKKVGFKIKNIFQIDGSKRSTKANAYFTGLGAKKRIVLFDTLINQMTNNEIVAVLAHEIGHYKKKHTLSSLIIGTLQTGVILYIFSLFVGNPELSKALGSNTPLFHFALIAFGFLYSPISTITGLGMNYWSRKNEFQADKFAADNYDGDSLISALKKLSINNLSNLTPHPLYVKFYYSHPTLLQRIRAIKNNK